MSKYIPEEIEEFLTELSPERQDEIWAGLVAKNLRISLDQSKEEIRQIRALPLEEVYAGIKTNGSPRSPKSSIVLREESPRIEAATHLLASISMVVIPSNYRRYHYREYKTIFTPDGSRGPRPLLVSMTNIASLLGRGTGAGVEFYRYNIARMYGGIDHLLTDMLLTASNPELWKDRGIEFSSYDIKKGLYLPEKPDLQLVKALAVIEADGHLRRGRLRIIGRPSDTSQYKALIPNIMERSFNLVQDGPHKKWLPSSRKRLYKAPELRYSSKGLSSYLEWIGFPATEEQTRGFGFNRMIQEFNPYKLEVFLKHFLPFAPIIIYPREAYFSVIHRSKLKLKGLQEFLVDFLGLSPDMRIGQPSGDYYQLLIPPRPMEQLYHDSFFNLSPPFKTRVRARLETLSTQLYVQH